MDYLKRLFGGHPTEKHPNTLHLDETQPVVPDTRLTAEIETEEDTQPFKPITSSVLEAETPSPFAVRSQRRDNETQEQESLLAMSAKQILEHSLNSISEKTLGKFMLYNKETNTSSINPNFFPFTTDVTWYIDKRDGSVVSVGRNAYRGNENVFAMSVYFSASSIESAWVINRYDYGSTLLPVQLGSDEVIQKIASTVASVQNLLRKNPKKPFQ